MAPVPSPEPISPASYVPWGGTITMPLPHHGVPQLLFTQSGQTAIGGRWGEDDVVLAGNGPLYALTGRSQLRERPVGSR